MKQSLLSLVTLMVLSIFTSLAQNPSTQVPAAQYYEGGQEAMYKFIDSRKLYPLNAKRNRIQGQCVIHIDIEPNGSISAATVVKNIGGGCGEEALRVVKLLKFMAPGYKFATNIPVNFKL